MKKIKKQKTLVITEYSWFSYFLVAILTTAIIVTLNSENGIVSEKVQEVIIFLTIMLYLRFD